MRQRLRFHHIAFLMSISEKLTFRFFLKLLSRFALLWVFGSFTFTTFFFTLPASLAATSWCKSVCRMGSLLGGRVGRYTLVSSVCCGCKNDA